MRISEVIIQVGDVDAAATFYTDVCGFTLVAVHEHEGVKVAELDGDGQRVSLVPGSGGVQLALLTASASRERLRLRDHEATGDLPDPVEVTGGSWLPFTDPWGNRLGFWAPQPATDPAPDTRDAG